MKKTFPLTDPVHKPARVIESIKRDIRRYLKRERRKSLPENVDFWDFTCRVGQSSDNAEDAHVAELNKKIDSASESNWASVYVEILATPGHRKMRKADGDSEESSNLSDESDDS